MVGEDPTSPAEAGSASIRRIAITGGSGFIGKHLTRRLVSEGADVTVLDPVRPEDRDVRWVDADLRDRDSVEEGLGDREFDGLVHLASVARRAASLRGGTDDLSMTANVLDLARTGRVARVIGFGSADQYGDQPPPQGEEDPLRPPNIYATIKTAADALIRHARDVLDLDVVVVRPFSVYGEDQPEHMFVSQLVRSCVAGREFRMSHGTQLRDFIHVGDVVEGVLRVLRHPRPPSPVYNLGTGVGTALFDLAVRVRSMAGSEIPIVRDAVERRGDPPALVADCRLAREELGFVAKIPVEEGLRGLIRRTRGFDD